MKNEIPNPEDLQGKYFHIRLLKYYLLMIEEKGDILDVNPVLYFDFPQGQYQISLEDLKKKADVETVEFLQETADELNGPRGSRKIR